MTTHQFQLIAIVLIACTPLSGRCAATAKEEYDLQKLCGQQAQDHAHRKNIVDGTTREKSNDGWAQVLTRYRNHYNKKMNKCYFLLSFVRFGKSETTTLATLLDINENKEYGSYHEILEREKNGALKYPPIINCNVSGKGCFSQKEWDALISPYMDD